MPRIEIRPEIKQSSVLTRLEFDVSYPGRRPGFLVFYETDGLNGQFPRAFDGILCAIITHAMNERMDVRLRGPATRESILNISEYQMAWSRWLPSEYQPIEIEADTVLESSPSNEETVSAYSGGVDATFTLFKHRPVAGSKNQQLSAALVVQGFDISLDDDAAFQTVLERARTQHRTLGVETLFARTNCRSIIPQEWEHSFAAQLASCLHIFSPRFSCALIGSSEPYDGLVLPWGSNPITDHLLSGGDMRIVHDGAGFSRTEKLAFLAQYPEALDNLRVCWEGSKKDRNCGVCEKCVRTKLNLMAVGVDDPKCFPQPLQLSHIDKMAIGNKAQLAEIHSILQFADSNGMEGEWVDRLRVRVGKGVVPNRKPSLRKILKSVGLLGTARKIKRRFLRRMN